MLNVRARFGMMGSCLGKLAVMRSAIILWSVREVHRRGEIKSDLPNTMDPLSFKCVLSDGDLFNLFHGELSCLAAPVSVVWNLTYL